MMRTTLLSALAVCVAAVVLLAAGGVDAQACPQEDAFTANWMHSMRTVVPNSVFDLRRLNEILVPGTHDAAVYPPLQSVTVGTRDEWVRTQAWNIAKQLCTGVRWFDLRFEWSDNKWMAVHKTAKLGGFGYDDWLSIRNQVVNFVYFHREIVILKVRFSQVAQFLATLNEEIPADVANNRPALRMSDLMMGKVLDGDTRMADTKVAAAFSDVLARLRTRRGNDMPNTGVIIFQFEELSTANKRLVTTWNASTTIAGPKPYIWDAKLEDGGGNSGSRDPQQILNGQNAKVAQWKRKYATSFPQERPHGMQPNASLAHNGRPRFGYRWTAMGGGSSYDILHNTRHLWEANNGAFRRSLRALALLDNGQVGFIGNTICNDFWGVFGKPPVGGQDESQRFSFTNNDQNAQRVPELLYVVLEYNRRIAVMNVQ